jgi:hypothetical protein
MTTLTVFLINVHAHLIFFEQDRFQEFQKKKNLLYLHCRTHFTKVNLAKTL